MEKAWKNRRIDTRACRWRDRRKSPCMNEILERFITFIHAATLYSNRRWNEIMLLFERKALCLRENCRYVSTKSFSRSRGKKSRSPGQASPFFFVEPYCKKEIYFQISYCASSGILYRISRARLPSLCIWLLARSRAFSTRTHSHSFSTLVSRRASIEYTPGVDGPSPPKSTPKRRQGWSKRVLWRFTSREPPGKATDTGTSISIAAG